MTRHLQLDLYLQDDVVFSLRSATQGDHEALDRIPGSALWGWAATWLHRRFPAQAPALAHAGRLRFGDASPLSPTGQPCYPVPLAWLYDKGRAVAPEQDGRLQADQLINRSHHDAAAALTALLHAKGLRGGHVSACGERVQARSQYRLRTALEAESGTARRSHLFGYQSLAAGQRFRGLLQIDDTQGEALSRALDSLVSALSGTIRLGRSRSTEYGRVQVKLTEVAAPSQPVSQGDRVTLWLLSDAQLRDAHGRPALTPDGPSLGLPGARLVPAQSALRHRSYSAWNAHRHAHSVERQMMTAGSVLVLERPGQAFTPAELARLACGLGCDDGHGPAEVWVNPPLLSTLRPRFDNASVSAPLVTPAVVSPPRTALAQYLLRQIAAPDRGANHRAWALAEEWIQRVGRHLQACRRYRGVPTDSACGPTASQWGALAVALESCRGTGDVPERVFKAVLGLAEAEGDAGSAQGRSGVHQHLRRGEDWELRSDGPSLAMLMCELITEQLGTVPGLPEWPARLRQAVHACQEIRRAELHTQAGLGKWAQKSPAPQPA
jgi:CRISPR-associated protein Csx10